MKWIFITLICPCMAMAHNEEPYDHKTLLHSEEFGILNTRIDNEVKILSSRLQDKDVELQALKEKVEVLEKKSCGFPDASVSYTHLTLPTNREV